MIDTKERRDAANELRSPKSYSDKYPQMLEQDADELDRLYLATTPLTREELETVLKEAGWTNPRPFHCEIIDLANYDLGFDCAILEDGTVYLTSIPPNKKNRTLFQGHISLLSRATLRRCGVIK